MLEISDGPLNTSLSSEIFVGVFGSSKEDIVMDMMEGCLKVKKNQQGFLLAIIHLPSSSTEAIFVQIDPFSGGLHHIGYIAEKHEMIPLPTHEHQSMETLSLPLLAQRIIHRHQGHY